MNIEKLEQRAASGDVNAQYELGLFYGDSNNLQPIQYLYWLKIASENGSGKAQYLLGKEYCKGIFLVANVEIGLGWLTQAAAQNIVEASIEIANIYAFGQGVAKDIRLADKYIYSVINNVPDPCILYSIGMDFYEGESLEVDKARAAEYFLKAARLNHPESQYLFGKIMSENQDFAKIAIDALYWLDKATQNGIADAAFLKAELICYNECVKFDLKDAIKSYEAAANLGSIESMKKLILLSDYENACDWMDKYLKIQNNCKSENVAFEVDADLLNIDTSFLDTKSVYDWYDWLTDNFELNLEAGLMLFDKLNRVDATPENIDLKIATLRGLVEKGHLPARKELAELLIVRNSADEDYLERCDLQVAANLYQLAAEEGDSAAQYGLAKLIFEHCDLEYEGFDLDNAIEWCEEAANNMHIAAEKLLVDMYLAKYSSIIKYFGDQIFDLAAEGKDIDNMGENGKMEAEHWRNEALRLKNIIENR